MLFLQHKLKKGNKMKTQNSTPELFKNWDTADLIRHLAGLEFQTARNVEIGLLIEDELAQRGL
tara:strand:+ start:188 stop:376 length:189 start_codon:yes stop_codon:yes gene_type:complete